MHRRIRQPITADLGVDQRANRVARTRALPPPSCWRGTLPRLPPARPATGHRPRSTMRCSAPWSGGTCCSRRCLHQSGRATSRPSSSSPAPSSPGRPARAAVTHCQLPRARCQRLHRVRRHRRHQATHPPEQHPGRAEQCCTILRNGPAPPAKRAAAVQIGHVS